MNPFRRLARRWHALVHKREWDAAMAEEMQLHLDLQTEENLTAGMSSREARFAAQRQFGHVEGLKEYCRDQRGFVWLEQLGQDLERAFRQLRRARGFTAAALLMLALGIGTSTAIFNVAYHTLIDPYPYRDVRGIWCPTIGENGNYARLEDYPAIARLPAVASAMASAWTLGTVSDDAGPGTIRVVHLSGSAWQFLGVPPLLGRGIGPDDISPEGRPKPVAVLTYLAWRQRYGGDPHVLGRRVRLNDGVFTIIGVAAPRFNWKTKDGLFVPLGSQSHVPWINTHVRLKPGFTPTLAAGEIAAFYQQLYRQNPERFSAHGIVTTMPGFNEISVAHGGLTSSLHLLLAAVGFVLLISCTNVANLQLARSTVRQREIAIRLALGSSQARLIRQLLVESVMLALAGGALGCLLSYGLTKAMMALLPQQLVPAEAMVTMNGPVLAFAAGVSIAIGILFGLAPVWPGHRFEPCQTLKNGGNSSSADRRQRGLGRSLVVIEIMLSVVLLFAATLTMRGFAKITGIEPGFQADQTLQVFLSRLEPRSPMSLARRNTLLTALCVEIGRLQGVRDVTVGGIPYHDAGSAFVLPGHESAGFQVTAVGRVSANYRKMMGIALLQGADFTEDDIAHARPVVLINEALAKTWPEGESPLGRTIRLRALLPAGADLMHPASPDAGLVTVVGIVGNTRNHALLGDIPPSVFIPYTLGAYAYAASYPYPIALTVRTGADSTLVLNRIRESVHAIDPSLSLLQAATAEALLDRQFKLPRFNMMLFTGLAAVAIIMACMGVYSLLAYQVAQRTREFGIRMALGAHPRDVLRIVFREGTRLLLTGLILGLGISLVLATVITSQVFIVPLLDLWALTVTSATLGITTLLACWLPARRATRVDPMIAVNQA